MAGMTEAEVRDFFGRYERVFRPPVLCFVFRGHETLFRHVLRYT